jgi:hypothetical protein
MNWITAVTVYALAHCVLAGLFVIVGFSLEILVNE